MEDKKPVNMRKKWFEFVAIIRRKMVRKTKEHVSHRDAMKEASGLWPKEKTRVLNKIKRDRRKQEKLRNSKPESKTE